MMNVNWKKSKEPTVIFGKNNRFELKILANLKLAEIIGSRLSSHPIMTLFIPVFLLPLAINTASWAEENCKNSSGHTVTCIESLSDGNGNNSCGINCSYKVVEENGKQVLHIYKTDITKSATIREGAFSPRYYTNKEVKDTQGNILSLQNIVFDNDFENIGAYAFAGSGANISSASGKFIFNNIGSYAVLGEGGVKTTLNGDVYINNSANRPILEASKIVGDIIFSDNNSTISSHMFSGTKITGNLIVPASVTKFDKPLLSAQQISGQIYCEIEADACYNMMKSACDADTSCETRIDNLFNVGKFSSYPDGCAQLEANIVCTKCKNENFRLNDGECDRIRYTPAEAAAVLKDTDNEIIMTFKVNR